MKRIVLCLFLQCSLILFFTNKNYSQTNLASSVKSSTGGETQGGTFKLTSTIGQSTPAALLINGQTNLSAGFIPTTLTAGSDNTFPTILHSATLTSPVNQTIVLQAEITDNVNVTSAALFFRKGGDASFTNLAMLPTGNTYNGVIPATAVQTTGTEYYIQAVDDAGNTSRQPNLGVFPVTVNVVGEGLQKSTAQPSGNSQNAYRLVSIPLAANNRNPSSILTDDLGEYNISLWRFFELQPAQTYSEFPNTSEMDPGKAFWLIVKDAGKFIDTGPATSNLTNTPIVIQLNAGWTLIGNPYNFPIPQNKITLGNAAALDIRSYSGAWNNYSGSLQPFDGYAVFSNSATTLSFDPQLVLPSGNKSNIESTTNIDWSINISATCQDAKDIDNVAAISKDALLGWDEFDRPEPPRIGDYLSVKFPHPDWEKISKDYCVDVRPINDDGETWDLEIETNIKDDVKIYFGNLETVPDNFEVWVVDHWNKIPHNIRSQNEFIIDASSINKNIKLIVGSSSYVKKEFAKMQLGVNEYKLHQNYPNPFNPTTTIKYSLASPGRVQIKVYNAIGKEVTTLINELKPTGNYKLTFDASNLSSGVYFYRIISGDFITTKKMILLK